MAKIRKKERKKLHPLMTYVVLIGITVLLSGFLSLIDVQTTFFKINNVNLSRTPVTEVITSLCNLHGIKYIFANTVSNFANFTVLANFIIVLMGISIMDKSGFLQTFITLTTKKLKKNTVTFIFVLLAVISSIFGDLAYLVFIPLGALLFYYGKRSPALGIITAFSALAFGSGISILFTSVDSSLIKYTSTVAKTIDANYIISNSSFWIIMLIAVVMISYIITIVTENILVDKLGRYEFTEEELKEDTVTKLEQRGMIYATAAGIVYLIIFIYNIIPYAPLGGNLLDYSQTTYIDMLFGPDAFFSSGFVFVVTMLFILLGLFYGIGAKSIKNHHDFCDNLGHSLDGIGNTLVLIFFASAFISIFKQTNIGNVIVGGVGSLIESVSFTGIPLIIFIFILVALVSFVVPSSEAKWYILSSAIVPVMMNAEMTPEFAQVLFRFAETSTMNLTPLLAYFIVYVAFLEKYNQTDKKIRMIEAINYQMPYTIIIGLSLLVLIIVWYLVGLPLGIGVFPTL